MCYTYGKLISRTGNSFVIFGYNGRDGVVTDKNGLIYMRARYYSPEMKRFINADIIPGEISNAVTLNRYAYANGNPVSNTDPFGLAVVCSVALSDVDLDPTDDYEHFGIGGSGGGGGGYLGRAASGFTGYDPSVFKGGSYYNYLVRNNTAYHDASLGGYYYEGTSATFETLGKYYVPGLVTEYDDMAEPSSRARNSSTLQNGSHASNIEEILKQATDAANEACEGNGPVAGTKKHAAFGKVIKKAGHPSLRAEQSYLNKKLVSYGTSGSIRFDAVEVIPGTDTVIRAWDLKTGNAILTEARILKMQTVSGFTDIPIIMIKGR